MGAEDTTIIVGGGLIGVTTLYELCTRGEAAVLVEAHKDLAHGTSFANGGLLCPSMPDPWNSPGIAGHILASLSPCPSRAGVRLQYRAIPGLALWGIEFLRNSTAGRHRSATIDNYRLARYSVQKTREVSDRLGLEYDLATTGTLKIFESEAVAAFQRGIAAQLEPLGLEYQTLSSSEIIAKEPVLRLSGDSIKCGVFYPQDISGDARKFCRALAGHARKLGGEIRAGTRVKSILLQDNKIAGITTDTGDLAGKRVVVAAGDHSPALVRQLGVRLPIKPAKGYSVTLDARDWDERPRIPLVDDAQHTAITPLGDRVRIVGSAEFAGRNRSPDPRGIDNLLRVFKRRYPQLARYIDPGQTSPWAGLRPMSADGRPFIGAAGPAGLWINSGHGHLGWTMAMGSAGLLADLMLNQSTAISAHPFRTHR